MNNNKNNFSSYVGRALRHLLKLVVLVAVLFGAMIATKTLAINPSELLGYRGAILLIAMVGISLAFPAYGFTSATIHCSPKVHKAEILQAMEMSGYRLVEESKEGAMVFRARSIGKRIINVGDEALTLTPIGEEAVEIAGLRKEVEVVRFRIVGLTSGTR